MKGLRINRSCAEPNGIRGEGTPDPVADHLGLVERVAGHAGIQVVAADGVGAGGHVVVDEHPLMHDAGIRRMERMHDVSFRVQLRRTHVLHLPTWVDMGKIQFYKYLSTPEKIQK